MQGNMQLHMIGSKHTIREEASREAIRALVNHPSAGDMDDMQPQGGVHLKLSQPEHLRKQPPLVGVALVVAPLRCGILCEDKQFQIG
jgi:hypothetical protein